MTIFSFSNIQAAAKFFLAAAFAITAMRALNAAEPFPAAIDTQEVTEPWLTPQEALGAISVPEGFHVSLYAAEPDVQQPISLATDARGRLWVVENYTYAEGSVNFEVEKQRDRILIFDDADGDGQFDTRKVFWDQGIKVTSVEVGFGGVWVLAAPNLLFIPDHDQDDMPDGPPQVMLDGWDGNRIRHNIVNGLRWGPDGWLYGRHGIQATSLVGTPETAPEHRTQLECGIWRFHPTHHAFEVVARGTTNPWGMDWDEHGQLFFINTVIGHLWHVVPGAYYQRMYGEHFDPHVYELLPQNADHYHWDIAEEAWSDTKKIGVTSRTDQAGGGHAHQGMMIYAGDNWPEAYRGKLMTFNFHGRRVNADRLERYGATYIGRHEDDFLRSSDVWFRGIEMVCGPDGGVIMADWSDIGECHDNDGIHRSSGRLFKVTYGSTPLRRVDLTKLSSTQLVNLLPHRNEWFSRHARRLLQERAVLGTVPTDDLVQAKEALFAAYGKHDSVTGQLRAMWGLYAIGGTSESWLLEQLKNSSEHVRVWAVQLLVDQGMPSVAVQAALAKHAATEESGLVLSFLAGALHRLPYEQRWPLAMELAKHAPFAADSHYPLFVWYGIEPAVGAFPERAIALAEASQLPLVRRHVARRLTEDIERQPANAANLVQMIRAHADAAFQRDILQGMHEASRGWTKTKPPAGWEELERHWDAANSAAESTRLVRELSVVFGSGRAIDQIRELVQSKSTPIDLRRDSIRSLVAARAEGVAPILQQLLTERYIDIEAIRGLAAYDHPDTPRFLIEAFPGFYQRAKQEAIATLVSRASFAHALLDAIQAGRVGRDEVSPFQIRQMESLADTPLQDKIAQHWPELRQRSTQKLQQVAGYRQSLTPDVLAAADLQSGRTIFQQQCAKCHRLFGEGELVGPDLTGSQRQNLNYLLENIVDPSATVSKNYQLTTILMADGRVVSGILLDQNDRTVTLRTTTERLVLSREEIEQIHESQLSLMPDRQLEVMSPDQVRDLIGFLMQG